MAENFNIAHHCRECDDFSDAFDVPVNSKDSGEPTGASFSSGAMRSEMKLPYWRMYFGAIQEYAKRLQKGIKYDTAKGATFNYKIGCNDPEFIRQSWDHGFEHLMKVKEYAANGPGWTDDEDEGILDHLGAVITNAAFLIEFYERNPEKTCKALSQESQSLPLE